MNWWIPLGVTALFASGWINGFLAGRDYERDERIRQYFRDKETTGENTCKCN